MTTKVQERPTPVAIDKIEEEIAELEVLLRSDRYLISETELEEAVQLAVDSAVEGQVIDTMVGELATPEERNYSPAILRATQAFGLKDPADLTLNFLRNALAESDRQFETRRAAHAARGETLLSAAEFKKRAAEARENIRSFSNNK